MYGEEFLSPIFYYLEDADWNKVDVDNVENWKLWYPPIPASRTGAELPPLPSPSSLPGTVVKTRKREVFLIKDESDEEDKTSEDSRPPPLHFLGEPLPKKVKVRTTDKAIN